MSKHNNFLPSNTDDDLLSEQGLQTLTLIPLIVLEGENDVKFFRYMFNRLKIQYKTESKGGWAGVCKFIEKWNSNENIAEIKKKHNKVIGIIDRDYHEYSGVLNFPNNIIKTDLRDLEVILFESNEALSRVLIKYGGSLSKYPKNLGGSDIDIDQIRDLIYQKSEIIGKVRYHKVVNNLQSFGINSVTDDGGLDNFFCYKRFDLDQSKFASLLGQKNPSINLVDINKWIVGDVNLDRKYVCRGHDIISILARSFRRKYNTMEAKEINLQTIEDDLLLAFPFSEFKELNYIQELFSQLDIQLPA